MLELPNVTLVIVDCVDAGRAEKSIDRCRMVCRFGAIKFLTSLPSSSPYRVEVSAIKSLNEYSHFMLKDLYRYVETSHVLVAQHDGWILNPSSWDDSFLRYDYIGALLPGQMSDDNVGNGGFSLRSRKLTEMVSTLLGDYKVGDLVGGFKNEDGVISKSLKPALCDLGCHFAPAELANRFSVEMVNFFNQTRPFGFHSLRALENLIGKFQSYSVDDLSERYPDGRCAIIGKGPSLIRLTRDMLDSVDFVITINHAIVKIREIDPGIDVFTQQKDRFDEQKTVDGESCPGYPGCECCSASGALKVMPIKKEILLIHRHESMQCFGGHHLRVMFDNEKMGMSWRQPSVFSAIKIASILGASSLKMVSHDSVTHGTNEYVVDGKTVCSGQDNYTQWAGEVPGWISKCGIKNVEWITPR